MNVKERRAQSVFLFYIHRHVPLAWHLVAERPGWSSAAAFLSACCGRQRRQLVRHVAEERVVGAMAARDDRVDATRLGVGDELGEAVEPRAVEKQANCVVMKSVY